MDLLKKMLEKDPNKRINANDCLKHPFLADMNNYMADDSVNDLIDEDNEFGGVASRMNALNEEYYNNSILIIELLNSMSSEEMQLLILQVHQELLKLNN